MHIRCKINQICQALQKRLVTLIIVTTSFFFTVISLGLPDYYHHLSARNVNLIAMVHQQDPRHFSCKTYISSWKAVRNLSVVASGFLTAILFKMQNDSSPESIKMLLIYPSLVLTTLALITSSMFIAHFEGETRIDTKHPSFARSFVFAIPAIMLVWGVFPTLAWIAYTAVNATIPFTNVAKMEMVHYVAIFVLVTSISIAFGTLVVVICTLRPRA